MVISIKGLAQLLRVKRFWELQHLPGGDAALSAPFSLAEMGREIPFTKCILPWRFCCLSSLPLCSYIPDRTLPATEEQRLQGSLVQSTASIDPRQPLVSASCSPAAAFYVQL